MNRLAYEAHLRATTLSGSNKGTSYLRALDLLAEMLAAESEGFEDCLEIWNMESIDRLFELQEKVREEQRLGDESVWNLKEISKSYLQNGYCSAALTSYIDFLVEYRNSEVLLETFASHKGSEDELAAKLEQPVEVPKALLEGKTKAQGKEVIREVKTRVNQRVFRDMILTLYRSRCCLTGLEVAEVNRASHIVGWAEEESLRLDPRNGLCLSATYDAAFDRHLITLDKEYRVVLSKDLKDQYSSKSFQEHFLRKEGEKIALPKSYLPKQEYLERHRSQGAF